MNKIMLKKSFSIILSTILIIISLFLIGFQNTFASGAAWSIDGASGFNISNESEIEFDGIVAKLISPYSTSKPYISPINFQTFDISISSFSHILGINNEGNLIYQISTDNGGTWNYWNTSAWSTTTSTDGTESSTVSDINTNIDTLDTDGGEFLWRAYLNSDGIQQVELDEVQIIYDEQLITEYPISAADMTPETDTGVYSFDNITNDNTPNFIGSCYRDDLITLYRGSQSIGTSSCLSNSYSVTPASGIDDGNYSITITFKETGKIESPISPSLFIEIDTTLPSVETPDLIDSSDTGISDTDNVTTDKTPTFTGNCLTGTDVYLYENETELASQICSSENNYNLTTSNMSDGFYNIYIKNQDIAGNEESSLSLSITINTSENFVCQGDSRFSGYAWSENIGWISFNCRDMVTDIEYGVTSDGAGNVSGYAWSENIGWINFGYYGNAILDLNTGFLSGDILSISGLEDLTDGWDGKISLSGSSPDYGPILDFGNYEFDGFAWGGDVVGWFEFRTDYSTVAYDAFAMSFTANKGLTDTNKVPYDGAVILSWNTDGGALSCSASDGVSTTWTDENPKTVGFPVATEEIIYNLTEDLVFTLTCQDSGGNQLERDIYIYVDAQAPYLSFTADDYNIPSGSSTALRWVAENVENCVASGDWSGSKGVGTNSEDSGSLTNSVNVFYLSCDSLYLEDYPDKLEAIVQIDVERLMVDFYAEHNPIPYNEKIRLFWETNFASSCIASGNLPEFIGAVPHFDGVNDFETEGFMTESGMQYNAILDCTGSDGQTFNKTIVIRVGKNPDYKEI